MVADHRSQPSPLARADLKPSARAEGSFCAFDAKKENRKGLMGLLLTSSHTLGGGLLSRFAAPDSMCGGRLCASALAFARAESIPVMEYKLASSKSFSDRFQNRSRVWGRFWLITRLAQESGAILGSGIVRAEFGVGLFLAYPAPFFRVQGSSKQRFFASFFLEGSMIAKKANLGVGIFGRFSAFLCGCFGPKNTKKKTNFRFSIKGSLFWTKIDPNLGIW